MANIGYMAEVTEYEAGGWVRPDGFILCLDKNDGIEFSIAEDGFVSQYKDSAGFSYSRASEFRLIEITDEALEILKDKKILWISNEKILFEKYVLNF